MLSLVITLVAFIRTSFAIHPTFSSVAEWKASKNSDKFGMVKDYVHYKLYFDPVNHDSAEACQKFDGEQLNNRTARLFAMAIDTCPVKKYSPRVLSSAQVSFKRHNDDDSKRPSRNESIPDTNITTNSSGVNTTEEDSDDNNVVHEYLAIAVVLPHHPFSRALIDAVRVISPMYPSVTIYFAIATEFESLCNQYAVRAFPSLLLFHKGLLVEKHSNYNNEKYKPAKLAKRFSRWTNSLPRTDPTAVSVSRGPAFEYYDRRWNNDLIELQNLTSIVEVMKEWCFSVVLPLLPGSDSESGNTDSTTQSLVNIDFGESIEPLVSLVDNPKTFDIPLYLISALYVLARFVSYQYHVVKSVLRNHSN